MKIGFVGLGRMGGNMARRLVERGGHEVIAFDPSVEAVRAAASSGVRGVTSLEELARALDAPRVLWVMVPAGPAVDSTFAQLAAVCGPGDLFVDGGNSHYKDTLRRAKEYGPRGFEVVDAGTSGGVWGRELGYCLMVGASPAAFDRLRPALEALAPEGGYVRAGDTGAGHFAKMIHNAIEYGMMQAYGEGFALLDASPFRFDLKALADVWNRGSVIRSWLLELSSRALEEDPKLQKVEPWVDDTGYGRWSVEAALDHAVPAPVIAESLFARFRSRRTDNFADRFIATLRKQFGGHATRTTKKGPR